MMTTAWPPTKGDWVSRTKLEQSQEALRAVNVMLQSLTLSRHTHLQLKNLKKLLELEISALQLQESDSSAGDGMAAD